MELWKWTADDSHTAKSVYNALLLGKISVQCFVAIERSSFRKIAWKDCSVVIERSSFRKMRNKQYSPLAVMSELSTVRCDRVLGL